MAVAVILFGHGVAHLPGFLVAWRLATLSELPHRTTVLANSVNVGERGIRVVGVLWLIAALAFTACGMGALDGHLPVMLRRRFGSRSVPRLQALDAGG